MKSTIHFEDKDKFLVNSLSIRSSDIIKFTFACSISYLESIKNFIVSDKNITEIAYDISSSFFIIDQFGELKWQEKYSIMFNDFSSGLELEFQLLNEIIKKINVDFDIPSKVP